MANKIASVVERSGGETLQIGNYQITIGEKLKLDKVIYNDILARRGFDAMQNNMTQAQYVDKFGASPDEYETAKRHATVAIQHIVPEQFRIAAETGIHIKLDDLLNDLKNDLERADEIGDVAKIREIYRKVLNDTIDYMKSVGLVSNQSADKYSQAREVISILINFILHEKEESKRYSIECPHCSKRFTADVSDKYGKRVTMVHDIIKVYEIMDVEGTDV
jgi:hypothetical protein